MFRTSTAASAGVDLSARKRVKTAEKREFVAALDPEHLGLSGSVFCRRRITADASTALVDDRSIYLLTTSGISRRHRGPTAHRACGSHLLPRTGLIVFEEAHAFDPLG